MPIPIDQAEANNIIGQAVSWLLSAMWGGLLFLVGVIWKKHNGEIDDLRSAFKKVDEALSRKVDSVEFEKVENRLRDGIIDLHKKIENSSEKLSEKLDRIYDKLDSKVDKSDCNAKGH